MIFSVPDRDPALLAEFAREVADWWSELHLERYRGTPRWAESLQDDPAEGYRRVQKLPPTHDCGRSWSRTVDGRLYCTSCATSEPIGVSTTPAVIYTVDLIASVSATILRLQAAVRADLGDGPVRPMRPPAGQSRRNNWVHRMALRQPLRAQVEATGPRRAEAIRVLQLATDPTAPDPRIAPALHYLARNSQRIMRGDIGDYVFDEIRRLTLKVRNVLGTGVQSRRIDAPCPICNRKSLVALLMQEEVVCTARDCHCEKHGCPCQRGQRHLWRSNEWPWLAELLDEALAASAAMR